MPNDPPDRSSSEGRSGRGIGVLGPYPPEVGRVAAYAAALVAALRRAGSHVTIVVVAAADPGDDGLASASRAEHQLIDGVAGSARLTADVLGRSDVAIVHHDFGLYGGDGVDLIDVLRALAVPAILVLHTVPAQPTGPERSMLESACDLAARVVVLSVAASARLTAVYGIDDAKVVMIPLGAAPPIAVGPAEPALGPHRTQLLTWGSLEPGRGIEHMIHAMAMLEDLRPRLRYTVVGATPPAVLERDGDCYRESLVRIAWATGVAGSVRFDDTDRPSAELLAGPPAPAVVVLPFDVDEVTSLVLVEAIVAGVPAIATAFPHAIELLSDGAGIVVPHGEPVALATAVRSAVSEPDVLAAMSARAREIAPSFGWPTVGEHYRRLCHELSPTETALAG